MYQLFKNGKPAQCPPNELRQGAIIDLYLEYEPCSLSINVEYTTDIINDSFYVVYKTGIKDTYTIEEV